MFATLMLTALPMLGYGAVPIQSAKSNFEDPSADWRKALSEELERAREQLLEIHQKALGEIDRGSASKTLTLAGDARELRERLRELGERWRRLAVGEASDSKEVSAYWHFPEISLFQLLNEFGSQEHLYIVPSDLSGMKVSVLAGFAIPKQTWPELIEWILAQRGLATRSINPLCRQVYRIADEPMALEAIITAREDLARLSPEMRVCFLQANSERVQSIRPVFEQFAQRAAIEYKLLMGQIALIGRCRDLLQLLSICDALERNAQQHTHRVLSLVKCSARDALAALQASGIASEEAEKKSPAVQTYAHAPLRAVALSNARGGGGQALFLLGTTEQIERATRMIGDIEEQIEDASGLQLVWHLCKHEQPSALAKLALQLLAMLGGDAKGALPPAGGELLPISEAPSSQVASNGKASRAFSAHAQKATALTAFDGAEGRIAFDAKSGYLALAVPAHLAPQMRAALERFDTPKHMVQIDFLLLERKVADTNRSGIQLLRLGASASQSSQWGVDFPGSDVGQGHSGRGILDFFLSHTGKSGYLPPYDLAYQFLIAQENVQIDANPSILTINGVPAHLDLVDETSINTGFAKVEPGDRAVQNTYIRAKYGIKIEITPYVQVEGDARYITLDTDVSFDTRKVSQVSRPDITTRRIKTLVRVGDGQSVILGGLKQKDVAANKESVPLLGEIPGIGKLFGSTVFIDKTTELFLFITPKIIGSTPDNHIDLERQSLMFRPGESEEFAQKFRLSQNNLHRLNLRTGLERILDPEG